jgi:hypothetical protein
VALLRTRMGNAYIPGASWTARLQRRHHQAARHGNRVLPLNSTLTLIDRLTSISQNLTTL